MNRVRSNRNLVASNRYTICGKILILNIIVFIILLLIISHFSLPSFLEDLLINQRIRSIPTSDSNYENSILHDKSQLQLGTLININNIFVISLLNRYK